MAKYKLTITDMESGNVEIDRLCDGTAGMAALRGPVGEAFPISYILASNMSAGDRLCMIIALDTIKEKLLKDPLVSFCYAHKDEVIKESITCDIGVLEKQLGK